jgi:hypothetical protein
MSKSVTKFFLIAAAIATSLTLAQAQDTMPETLAPAHIVGSYQVTLVFPKAKPTVQLTFCKGGEPFTGAWVEDMGEKVVGEMYNKKIEGGKYIFTVKAGPGIWDFVVSSDGETLKGTVTGDGATSSFEGPKVKLTKEWCK